MIKSSLISIFDSIIKSLLNSISPYLTMATLIYYFGSMIDLFIQDMKSNHPIFSKYFHKNC
jgi:hypothetical protein